uniref:non-specific serine/threonine protein kinase n=1 Tax=Chlamydomonas euryale TaxID=1486919 RepID=A0A7R9YT53_9CHLO|mmetsp:Transcript_19112/g.56822  ORF Transcript_19112/g.56822 Transcript_19112/m.56822 type:complete len:459 (+) Transcript_19112:432-1808(+)
MDTNDVGLGGSPRDDSNDEAVETDPDGRYYRYRELVGRGKFKACHKAFDSHHGIDVAWSKFEFNLSDEELERAVTEIRTNVNLEHPNIIKSYLCWEDMEHHCINLITELFTSGNLRQFRAHYPHLDLKAVKRIARQILRGLQYLHSMVPPITHGDLRCDKIYVNGNSGEIKIGDIGLATLMPYRWGHDSSGEVPADAPARHTHAPPNMEPSWDIFAFGLCMLELLTLKQLDPQHCSNWGELMDEVQDEEAKALVVKCLERSASQRPNADELLDDPFFRSVRKLTNTTGGDASIMGSGSSQPELMHGSMTAAGTSTSKSMADIMAAAKEVRASMEEDTGHGSDSVHASVPVDEAAPITVGKLRGEDYEFEFGGKVHDGKMHFRLVMTRAVEDAPSEGGSMEGKRTTIDFVFDPEVDTADTLAAEISETFNLSPTDTEICAAALREWLAKEMPGLGDNAE